MTWPNRQGPEGTAAALRATSPVLVPVASEGDGSTAGDDGQAPGHGAAIDQALSDLDSRVSALESGEAGESS